MKNKVVVVQENIHPYHISLLNALRNKYKNMFVLYAAAKQKIRWWDMDRSGIRYDYKVLYEGMIEHAGAFTCFIDTWRSLGELNPDVVIIGGWGRVIYWASLLWAKSKKKKIIVWSESNYTDKARMFLKEWPKSVFVSNCDAGMSHGLNGKKYLVKLGLTEDHVRVMGAITDNDFYREKIPAPPRHNFLFLGRFSPEKNIFSLLNAYKRLKNNGCVWGLILAGGGHQEKAIKKYLKRHAINGVDMPGFLERKDISRYFSISGVLVLPSVYEPWGMVVGEAMSAGLAVLVSKKCGCVPELVGEGVNGFSFDPYNEDELFRRMEELTSGKHDLESMCRASLDIIKEHTPERSAEILAETITEIFM